MDNIKELGFSPDQGMLVIEKSVPQIGRLLWHTTLGNTARINEIILKSRVVEDSYLAHESVRKGHRAGIIVGNLDLDGQRLPYTGLEPYTVGLGLTVDEIIKIEAEAGMRIIRSLGNSDLDYQYLQNLHGLRADTGMIKELATIYGALVARFRALGESDRSGFRSDTYAHIQQVPNISYWVNGDNLSQRLILPRVSTDFFPTTKVGLTDKQLRGYMFVSELGRFGHPLVREAVRLI